MVPFSAFPGKGPWVSGKVKKEILIPSFHLFQAFFPSVRKKPLKSFYMVEFDTSKRENIWIEVVAVRWDNKLGRRRLALLNIKMYYACSLSNRKIDAPSYEDSFSSIVVDENNTIKASSKLLKLFITHIAKLNVFPAKKAAMFGICASCKKNRRSSRIIKSEN